MRSMVRGAIATLTGCTDPIRPMKRRKPRAEDKRRDRSRYAERERKVAGVGTT
jgi:hypothetical protein